MVKNISQIKNCNGLIVLVPYDTGQEFYSRTYATGTVRSLSIVFLYYKEVAYPKGIAEISNSNRLR
ncbi:hypothetical protein [Nostoc sp. JL33]|uniref:hypothetical protein n=1 Tax=Nostoc sp. JL33 TaxID=2815396 RepID=UPI0025F85118|nr:hypothetical protein [Nostoc sp. JL33]MBN3872490.1 hypothetical protein [Nostoc sp. JL33]